jgi:hypothetical protein
MIPLPRFDEPNELPHQVAEKVTFPVNDTQPEQNLQKPGSPLILLHIGLVGAKKISGSQRVAFVKENGICQSLLE